MSDTHFQNHYISLDTHYAHCCLNFGSKCTTTCTAMAVTLYMDRFFFEHINLFMSSLDERGIYILLYEVLLDCVCSPDWVCKAGTLYDSYGHHTGKNRMNNGPRL